MISSAYVDRTCLANWRAANANAGNFTFCDLCYFKNVIETVVNDPVARRRLLKRCHYYVFRDITAIILVTQSVIIAVARRLRRMDDKTELIKMVLILRSWMGSVYYLSTVLVLQVIVGLLPS